MIGSRLWMIGSRIWLHGLLTSTALCNWGRQKLLEARLTSRVP